MSSASPSATHDLTGRVPQRSYAKPDVQACLARGGLVGSLVLRRFTLDRALERGNDALVAKLAHGQPAQLVRRRLQYLHEAGVELRNDEVAVVEEHAHRRLLDERAVPLLRLAQRFQDVPGQAIPLYPSSY